MDVTTRPAKVTEATACRSCQGVLVDVLDLGAQPLANDFCPTPDHDCYRYPLVLTACQSCELMQLRHEVDRADVFKNYHYKTGASAPMQEHFKALADELKARLRPLDLVVDIGSNDGTFLANFTTRTLGVDPGGGASLVPSMMDFFDHEIAWRIKGAWGQAKVITACNVLAHTSQPREMLEAARDLLTDDGVIVVEVPDAAALAEKAAFDTVYHEHLYYFTAEGFRSILPEGLRVEHSISIPTHGGSIRLYLEKGKSPEVISGFGVQDFSELSERVYERKQRIRGALDQHGQVAGYGAPAKATVLLNYLDVGPEKMPYVVDSTPDKQGTYVPGVHIPVRREEELGDEPILILAWNYADVIRRNHPTKQFLEV